METILAQTVTDWELIICDGYSDDGSWEFFQKFRNDPRVTLFQAPRLGTPGSWNYCLERARGEYFYIATSDDTMSSDCLESLLRPLESNGQIGLAICDFEAIDDQGRIVPERHRHEGPVPFGLASAESLELLPSLESESQADRIRNHFH